jgi:hypothetical protein
MRQRDERPERAVGPPRLGVLHLPPAGLSLRATSADMRAVRVAIRAASLPLVRQESRRERPADGAMDERRSIKVLLHP